MCMYVFSSVVCAYDVSLLSAALLCYTLLSYCTLWLIIVVNGQS